MAEDSTELEVVGIQWKMDVDKKSVEKSDKAAENMIGLLADLAIVGKVAGEALGKLWSSMQKTLELSLAQFDDINIGLTYSVDPEDVNALKFAVGQIGGSDKDAMSMLGQIDKVIQSFRNPATGPEEIEKFFKELGTYGVDQEATDNILKAVKDEDLIEALKLLGDTRNQLGDEFSNFMNKRGLSGLANLELDYQYEDWIEAWGHASDKVNDVDLSGLNDLENGMADINFAIKGLLRYFGSLSGSGIAELGDSILKLTNTFLEWADAFKMTPEAKALSENVKDFFSPKDTAFDKDSEMSPMEMRVNKMKQILGIVKAVDDARTMDTLSTEGLSASEWGIQTGMGNMGLFGQNDKKSKNDSDDSSTDNSVVVHVDTMNVITPDAESTGSTIYNELQGLN